MLIKEISRKLHIHAECRVNSERGGIQLKNYLN